MKIAICFFIIYLAESFIIWHYCSSLFTSKYSVWTERFALLCLYSLLFTISLVFPQQPILNLLSFFLANYLLLRRIFQIRWRSALFHTTSVSLIMLLSECIAFGILPELSLKNFLQNAADFQSLISLTVVSKIIYFLLLNILLQFLDSNKKKPFSEDKSILLLSVIPIVSIYIIVLLSVISWELPVSPGLLDLMFSAGAILLLLCNIFVFRIYSYNLKKHYEFTEMQLLLQKESDSARYYKMLLCQSENHSLLIHDINKHLHSIAMLNSRGEQRKVADYIERITASSELQTSVRICSNELLNVILNRYMQQCSEKKISFRADIRKNTIDFMTEDDLTALFCNLLDNAVEAAASYSDGFVELHADQRANTVFTVLTMTNSCLKNPFTKKGTLPSAKPNHFRHGFGLKSIRRIVEKYSGDVQYYYTDDTCVFHTIITLQHEKEKK